MGKKGYYIMFEGGEGCGKDYHADLVCEWIKEKGLEVVLTREPGGTFEAEQIRDILLKKENNLSPLVELWLYEAARKDLSDKVIIPSINQGKIVISKRGFPSTYAYQGFGGNLDLEIIKRENELAMRNVFPDILFIIDINPLLGLSKEVNPDRFAKKGFDYHKRVNDGYLEIAKMFPEISVIIPYQKDNPEIMQNKIHNYLEKKLDI